MRTDVPFGVVILLGTLRTHSEASFFQDGQVIPTSVASLSVEIEFKQVDDLLAYVDKLCTTVNHFLRNHAHTTALDKKVLTIATRPLFNKYAELRRLAKKVKTFEQFRPLPRRKRFLGLVLSATALVAASANRIELEMLKSRVNHFIAAEHTILNKALGRLNALTIGIANLTNDYLTFKQTELLHNLVDACQPILKDLHLDFISMARGEFPPNLLDMETIEENLSLLNVEAKKFDLDVAISARDIFSARTKWGTKDGILSVFIPLKGTQLDLFRFVPHPVMLAKSDSNLTFAFYDAENHIALTKDRSSFVTLTSFELSQCLRHDDSHFCEFRQFTLSSDFSQDCTAALFRNDNEIATSICPLRIQSVRGTRVIKLGAGQFFVASSKPFRATRICRGNTSSTDFAPGLVPLTTPSGCKTRIPGFTLIHQKTFSVRVSSAETGLSNFLINSTISLGSQVLEKWTELGNADKIFGQITAQQLKELETDENFSAEGEGSSSYVWESIAILGALVLSCMIAIAIAIIIKLRQAKIRKEKKARQNDNAKSNPHFTYPKANPDKEENLEV